VAQNTWEWANFCDFRLKSLFILEAVRDRPMVAMEREQGIIGGGSTYIGYDDLA